MTIVHPHLTLQQMQDFEKAIKENTENMTVFLVSQRVSTIRNADHILVLDDGKIAGIGTHLQLLKENQVYKEICESQMAREEA